MSVKERMHQLIDELPEDRIRTLEMLMALMLAPEDDEPGDPQDEALADAEWDEYLRGDTVSAEEAKRQLLG